MHDLTALILTFNEDKHIARCIASVRQVASRIVVVDSGSTDATVELARAAGAEVVFHPFETQARQLNWALDSIPIATTWTMRLDADEHLTPELVDEISSRLPTVDTTASAVALKRRVVFMGRWIRHGGIYPTTLVRIWRTGDARSEDRAMDEHMLLARGAVVVFDHDIIDENLNDLTWWTSKHNTYASREAKELAGRSDQARSATPGGPARAARLAKNNLYLRLPPISRAWMYFLYRYFVRLGFLDGREGLIFHSLQGLWYRLLADAKTIELSEHTEP
jgi:glycosyltransferase involved in cell wall biosynthesis